MIRAFSFSGCTLGMVCLLGWAVVAAQEAEPPAKTAPAKAQPEKTAPKPEATAKEAVKTETADVPAPATGARGEFDKQIEEWKAILKEMRELRTNFQTAKDEEQKKLAEQFSGLVAKGNAMLPKLRETALAAFIETGSADPQLERFLLKFVSDAVDADEYEVGLTLTKKLLEGGSSERLLPGAAGICAFCTNDYDLAEVNFKAASESGVFQIPDIAISKLGQQMMPQVAAQKGLWEKELAIRKAEEAKDDLPRVKLTTNKGVIVLELFENEAPDTVGNFISLVEKKFYDGLTFHRVLAHFMAQGGDPKGDGSGGPGYQIYCECTSPDYRRHFRGSLSMAKTSEPDTGGSQFFLTFRPTPELDGRHTCFGRVIEGLDVLAKLQRRDPETDMGVTPDKIVTAEVIRKREHAYAPKKVEQ